MWFCRKSDDKNTIPAPTFAAIIISVVSLALAAGVIRWSWIIVDEQVRLRREFVELKSSQDQLNTQFEFWNKQLQKERQEIKELKGQ